VSETLQKPLRRVCLLKPTPCPPWCSGDCSGTVQRYTTGNLAVSHRQYFPGEDFTVGILQYDYLRKDGRLESIPGIGEPEIRIMAGTTYETVASAENAEEYRALLRMGPVLLPGVVDALREAGRALGWEPT